MPKIERHGDGWSLEGNPIVAGDTLMICGRGIAGDWAPVKIDAIDQKTLRIDFGIGIHLDHTADLSSYRFCWPKTVRESTPTASDDDWVTRHIKESRK